VQRSVSYESVDVQTDSSRPSNARFAVFECSQCSLLSANTNADEAEPMPLEQPSN
jgi:hypothetical protein